MRSAAACASQVAQAEAPGARREQAVELGFGVACRAGFGSGDAARGARLGAVAVDPDVERLHALKDSQPAAKKFL